MTDSKTKILVLCHANRWRSPLAHVLLAQYNNVEIRSSGFKEANRPAGKPIREAAESLGLDLSDHRSSVITHEMVAWADIVIYMDGGNLKRLLAFEGVDARLPNWRCLAEYVINTPGLTEKPKKIPDPAFQKKGSDEFNATVKLIQNACNGLIEATV